MLDQADHTGLHEPGDGLFHRLDPRIKTLGCLGAVLLSFGADRWLPLALLAGALGVALQSSGLSWRGFVSTAWRLRWLLLLTLLMHLLMTPGHTLWGTRWLSRDGLLLGLRVDLQVLLALGWALLLARTTTTDDLSRTFGWALAPLHHLGFRVGEWQQLLRRALQYLPVVRAEAVAVAGRPASSANRLEDWSARLEGYVLKLVDFGEETARGVAAGGSDLDQEQMLPPLRPVAALDRLFLAALAVLTLLCNLTG